MFDQPYLPAEWPGWEDSVEGFVEAWKPARPLAGWAKDSRKVHMTRERALSMPMIQVNPPTIASLIVTDVDTSDVDKLPELVGLPVASWTVRSNNAIGSGHVGYALASPVCLTDAGSRKAVNHLARIELGICDVLGGDPSYSGGFTKNPVVHRPEQATLWGETFPTYRLQQLARALDELGALPAWNSPRTRLSSGIGRNVDLFTRVRKWAYRAIARHRQDGFEEWSEMVHAQAIIGNEAFERESRIPLPANEVSGLARSVARWVWTRRGNPEAFRARQKTLSTKGYTKRWKGRREAIEMFVEA